MREWKLQIALLIVTTVASCLGLLFFTCLIPPLVSFTSQSSENISAFSVDQSKSHTTDSVEDADSDELILHYVRLYANRTFELPLKFLPCLGVYSAIINLQPSIIYLHTNSPTPFPFQNCEELLNVTIKWPPVRTVIVSLEFVMNGQRIREMAHEADIRKLKAVEMYGGIVLDFDVLVINGSSLRESLRTSECVICHEDQYTPMTLVNAGLLGCRKKNARFPQLVLEKSYRENYDAEDWLYNSGVMPWEILEMHNDTATVLDGPCNHDIGNWSRNYGSDNWTSLPAYHTYVHDNQATKESMLKLNSPLETIARWLLPDSIFRLNPHIGLS